MKIKQRIHVVRPDRGARGRLSLVAAEAVLVEVALAGLAPLLLGLAATAVSAGTARHLLIRLGHARTAKAGLVLARELSAGARSCPRVGVCFPVL